jgi:hypothetical protein
MSVVLVVEVGVSVVDVVVLVVPSVVVGSVVVDAAVVDVVAHPVSVQASQQLVAGLTHPPSATQRSAVRSVRQRIGPPWLTQHATRSGLPQMDFDAQRTTTFLHSRRKSYGVPPRRRRHERS